MSKVLLHFMTELGPRTLVVEIGDAATARAVVNTHLAAGSQASVVEEMPRMSLKGHMAKHRRAKARAVKVKLPAASNVTPMKKRGRA
jgi:hypothetical protein